MIEPTDVPATKVCTRCDQAKPLGEFNKRSRSKDGLNYWCRTCGTDYAREWYQARREQRLKRNRDYRASHLDEIRAYDRQRAPERRESRREYGHQWRIDHGQELRDYQRQRYLANRGTVLNNVRRYRQYRPFYTLWVGMLARCENPTHKDYANYGARGIAVCAEWHDYQVFADWIMEHLGPRPDGRYPSGHPTYSFDRIDNDGDYEPGNVRWATKTEQRRNQRRPPTRITELEAEVARLSDLLRLARDRSLLPGSS